MNNEYKSLIPGVYLACGGSFRWQLLQKWPQFWRWLTCWQKTWGDKGPRNCHTCTNSCIIICQDEMVVLFICIFFYRSNLFSWPIYCHLNSLLFDNVHNYDFNGHHDLIWQRHEKRGLKYIKRKKKGGIGHVHNPFSRHTLFRNWISLFVSAHATKLKLQGRFPTISWFSSID
jgi:hypothetical protein